MIGIKRTYYFEIKLDNYILSADCKASLLAKPFDCLPNAIYPYSIILTSRD